MCLGAIAARWVDRLGGVTVTVTEATDATSVTTLVGKLSSPAYSLYELHLPLLLVERLADVPQ